MPVLRVKKTYLLWGRKGKNPLSYSTDLTGHEIAGEDYYLEREGYYTYLLLYTARGSGHIEYSGKSFSVKEGDLLFIDCNRPQKYIPEVCDWEFYFIHVNGPALSEFMNDFYAFTGESVLHNFKPEIFINEISSIHQILDKNPTLTLHPSKVTSAEKFSEQVFCQLSTHIYSLLLDVWEQLSSLSMTIPSNILQAQAYIRNNFTRKITLEEIAASVYLSPYHLAHQFKKYTGITVGEAIAEERIHKATELLASTDKKIFDIAIECGFSDSQMLKKLIKKNLGVTPSEYRRIAKEKKAKNVIAYD